MTPPGISALLSATGWIGTTTGTDGAGGSAAAVFDEECGAAQEQSARPPHISKSDAGKTPGKQKRRKPCRASVK
jgi:hypothetical protein